jgi:hypothetical protein
VLEEDQPFFELVSITVKGCAAPDSARTEGSPPAVGLFEITTTSTMGTCKVILSACLIPVLCANSFA